MLIKNAADIASSEITPQTTYRRRDFLVALVTLPIAGKMVTTTDALTPKQGVTTYGNFYEFGSDKGDAVRNAAAFKPAPWSVAVEGLCGKPGTYTLEDVLKPHPLEERVYRPAEMAGQRRRFPSLLPWPYQEGLRMDEAMHPLTILAAGLYGETLLNQNGAPLRLVVPWKYGFKSIKSIVKITFVDRQPINTWQEANAEYYGFYANVNPGVPTPSYSQATERRIGEFLMRRTLMFNGYADRVASLYSGMNLRTLY